MEKKTKIKFTIVAVLLVIGILLSTLSFNLIGSDKIFNGFLGAIETSTELDDYYSITFNIVDDEITENKINKTIQKFYEIIDDYVSSYSDFNISRQTTADGVEQLVLTCSENVVSTSFYGGSSFFNALGAPIKLGVKTTDSADATNLIDNSNIESVTFSAYSTYYAVYLTLDNEGTQNLIRYSNTTLYYYIDGEKAEGGINGNYLYVYKTDYTSQSTAYYAGVSMLTGALPLEIAYPDADADETPDTNFITAYKASIGEGTKTVMSIVIGLIAVLAIVYFVLKYKWLGAVASLSLVAFMVVLAFMLQAIPLISMTLGSYFGVLITMLLTLVAINYLLVKIRAEYDLGKALQPSIKMGYKKAVQTLVDINVVALIGALALLILGQMAVKNIAIVMIAGIIISAAASIGLNYLLILWLHDLTDEDKNYNFTREAK